MKRYFFFALIVASASVTSISAFATCPMEAERAAKQEELADQKFMPMQTAGASRAPASQSMQMQSVEPTMSVAAEPAVDPQ